MNFIDYEKSLSRLLKLPDTRLSQGKIPKQVTQYFKGIYVISRNKDDLTFKIGVAYGQGGLKPRLQSYKLCYPYKDEFYIHYIIITPTGDGDAKQLEKIILSNKTLEHTEENKSAEGKKSKEYKVVSSHSILKQVLIAAMDANPNLWTHCVVFGDNGWNIIRNFDGSAIKKMVRPRYTSSKKPSLYDNVDVNLKDFYVTKRTWKKGDIIDTPWGKAEVVKVYKNGQLEGKWEGYSGTWRITLH